MAVSGHGSEGQAGSQGGRLLSRSLLSLLVWEWVELCGFGAPGPSSPPDAGQSCPAGCKTPSWVKVQPQGAPLREPGGWGGVGERAPENQQAPHSPPKAPTPTQLALQ